MPTGRRTRIAGCVTTTTGRADCCRPGSPFLSGLPLTGPPTPSLPTAGRSPAQPVCSVSITFTTGSGVAMYLRLEEDGSDGYAVSPGGPHSACAAPRVFEAQPYRQPTGELQAFLAMDVVGTDLWRDPLERVDTTSSAAGD